MSPQEPQVCAHVSSMPCLWQFCMDAYCIVSNPVLFWCADWWSKSDFVLNELNVQSVVTAPAHDEMIPLSASGTYTVKGFAYSGACNLLHVNPITDTIGLQCNIMKALSVDLLNMPVSLYTHMCVGLGQWTSKHAFASSTVSAVCLAAILVHGCILCGWGFVMEL